MWVSVVLGFDQEDGQLIEKWREAFQRHGELVGEFFQEEEYVGCLRRHTSVARIKLQGKDLLPPIVDAVTRVARGKVWNVSGISKREPWNKWSAQAWRMEVLSIDGPPPGWEESQMRSTEATGAVANG